MWTYLTILLAAFIVLAVFVRRLLKMRHESQAQTQELADSEIKDPPVAEEEAKKKERLSLDDEARLLALIKSAESKLKVGKEDEAIKLLVQALSINDKHEDALHKLAMLYMQKEMFSAAAELFTQLGELTNEAIHYSHLGLALFQQREFSNAKDAYIKSLVIDDTRPQRFVSLAQVYRAMGLFPNAVIAVNRAIETSEDDSRDFKLILVDVLLEWNKLNSAKRILNSLLEENPEDEMAKKYMVEVEKLEKEQEEKI